MNARLPDSACSSADFEWSEVSLCGDTIVVVMGSFEVRFVELADLSTTESEIFNVT